MLWRKPKQHNYTIFNKKIMFGLFKKKSPLVKLQEAHKKVLEDAFKLSKSNRSESDKLYAQAAAIEKEIAALTVDK